MGAPHPPDGEPTLSPGELTEIIRSFSQSDLQELRLSVGGVDLLLSRNERVDVGHRDRPLPAPPAGAPGDRLAPLSSTPPGVPPPQPPTIGDNVSGHDDEHLQRAPSEGLALGHVPVLSQAVGVFYRRPSPDEPPYVEVGSAVSAGDPIGIMEVMKMFTTVRSEVSGTVTAIHVADGTLVEYHQVLMVLDTGA